MIRCSRGPVSLALAGLLAASMSSVPAAAAPTWVQPAVTLSASGQSAYNPMVAVDAAGNATAVFSGGGAVIKAVTRPAGGTWGAPVDLTSATNVSLGARILVDAAGNATAVWLEQISGNTAVRAATRPAGGVWSFAVTVAGSGADSLDAAVNPAGTVAVVWRHSDGGTYRVRSATKPPGGSWTSPVFLSVAGNYEQEPDIAVNAAGAMAAVWGDEPLNGNLRIQASTRSAEGGAWSAPVNISAAGQSAFTPRVVLDASGRATAIWTRSDGSNSIVQSRTKAAGGGWSLFVVPLSAPGLSAAAPQIAVDGSGNATVVWSRSNGSHDIVQATTRVGTGAWSAPVNLSVAGQNADSPAIAVDPQGDATVVWQRFNGTQFVIQSARRVAGGAWSAADNLTDNSPTPGLLLVKPQIVSDSAGNGVAVWGRENSNGHVDVQGIGLDAAGPVLSGLSMPTAGLTNQALSYAVAATDVWSAVGSTVWSFGDGGTATGANVTHSYTSAGAYPVTVTSTDSVGNASSLSLVSTITTTPQPPIVKRLKLTKQTIHVIGSDKSPRKTKLKIKLSTAAKTKFRIKRTHKLHGHAVIARFHRSLPYGASVIKLTSKIDKKKLPPGTYRIRAIATNSVGSSPPRRVRLIIKR